jgi:hypothetical protein
MNYGELRGHLRVLMMGTFMPERKITREETMMIIARAMDIPRWILR